jgi:hypothetical protein
MPTLLRQYATVDEIPAPYREMYKPVEKDGKTAFINDDIEDVTGLKATVKATRTERDEAKARAKVFEDAGLSADEIDEIKDAIAERKKRGTKTDDDDVEALIDKRIKARDKEVYEPVVKERDELRSENRQLLLTDKVRSAFIAAGGLDEDADDVVRIYEARFDLKIGEDKKKKIVVLDEDGDPTGQSPKEFFEKLQESRPKFFKGSGGSGGGAEPVRAAGGTGAREALMALPPAERLTASRNAAKRK